MADGNCLRSIPDQSLPIDHKDKLNRYYPMETYIGDRHMEVDTKHKSMRQGKDPGMHKPLVDPTWWRPRLLLPAHLLEGSPSCRPLAATEGLRPAASWRRLLWQWLVPIRPT